MMTRALTFSCSLVLLLGSASPVSATQIFYTLTSLGSGNWEYDYTVNNSQLSSPLGDFVIYFPDVQSPSNFAYSLTSSTEPAGWLGSLIQPSAIDLGGYYEATTSSAPIPVGGSLSGFDVVFNYTGTPSLGSQSFEIYDNNLNLLDLGNTQLAGAGVIPEPRTLLLLGSGIATLGLRRMRRRSKV